MDYQYAQIIEYVRQQPGIHAADLAGRLGVSTRTLRTYVKTINAALDGCAAIRHERSKGFRLEVTDEVAFDDCVRSESVPGKGSLPVTRKGRVSYLLNDLLSRADWVTLDELAGILYVSTRTLTDDLRLVEEKLAEFDLSLERRPHYDMRIAGPELNRRLCAANLAIAPAAGRDFVAGHGFDIKVISACVEGACTEARFQVNSLAYQNLLVHIAVALSRINANCYVPMEPDSLQTLRDTREYAVAGGIASRIDEAFNVELPDEEIAYIAIHLSGKQALQEMAGVDAEGEQGLVISDEVWDVVSRMLERIWNTFRFDFRGDLELKMNLARHIVPLSVRLRFHMRMDNPLLSDIKSRFPLAYSMAVDAGSVLTEAYGAVPSDDEIGYIALAFALAIERQKDEEPKKRILVVCASGAGSAKLLEYRYRQEFGPYVDDIMTCDVAHVGQQDFSKIDYVFTTVSLAEALPVPVREVGFFLDEAEIEDVKSVLSASLVPMDLYASYFPSELFFPHVAAATRDEAISFLCEAARGFTSLPEDFERLVLQREDLAPTAFGNFVAMPHPIEPVSDETFVAVALLDESISWNGRDVRAVFLVSIARERERDLNEFYDSFSRLLLSKDAVARVLSARSREQFLCEFRAFSHA